jgi:hypothetical protein
VQRRLNQLNTIDPDALLFCSREGTPLTTINEHAGVELASQ